ncbi:MAG TPA: ABC transporter permease [Azospirillaceae bacterium]|nr:ABC transporter permease [Azospirillaceae bacterium]
MNHALMLSMAADRLVRFPGRTILMGLAFLTAVYPTTLLQMLGGGAIEALNRFVGQVYPVDTVSLYPVGTETLTLADIEAVLAEVPELRDWDPVVEAGRRDLKAEGQAARVRVVGWSERAARVGRRGVTAGGFLSAGDVRMRAGVALIGSSTARRLFGDASPIGRRFTIDALAFEVKGVLEPFGVDPHGDDQDDLIVLPYTTLMERLLRVGTVTGARFLVDDAARVEPAAARLTWALAARRGLAPGQPNQFNLRTPAIVTEEVARVSRLFAGFTLAMGLVTALAAAKLVAGLMLAMVAERTAELGLRKALGARPADLRRQILAEVAIVALCAAALGLLLAALTTDALTPWLAAAVGMRELDPSASTLAVGAGAALVAGLAAAWLPARRAAALDPVAALR